jgi:hypothetical protein
LHWVTALENGAMENAQALAVFVSLCLFSFSAARERNSKRVFFTGMALLCLSFLLREVDVEDLDVYRVLILLTSGFGRNLLLVLLWSFYLSLVFKHSRSLWQLFTGWAKSFSGQAMIMAGIFFVLGWPFDREILPVSANISRLLEELLELNGHLLILLSSVSIYAETYRDSTVFGSIRTRFSSRLPRKTPSRFHGQFSSTKPHIQDQASDKKKACR